MACCGGNVNVVTTGDADFTDARCQTDDNDDDETYKKEDSAEETPV